MKPIKKQKDVSFEKTHSLNKFRNNKYFPIIVSIFAVVFLIVMTFIYVSVNNNHQKNKTIEMDYKEYTTVTAAKGQQYTKKDSNGNVYLVKEDGMYCETDYGYVKVNYNKPLNKFNKYRYELYSGAIVEITLYKDGTYDYVFYYGEGNEDHASGKYKITTGINNAFSVLKIEDKKDFSDAFLYDSGAINPNDLFAVTLYLDKYERYDSDGNIIKEESDAPADDIYDPFEHENERENEEYPFEGIVDQLVIYLKQNGEDVTGVAYDTYNRLLLNEDYTNGSFDVDYSDKGVEKDNDR